MTILGFGPVYGPGWQEKGLYVETITDGPIANGPIVNGPIASRPIADVLTKSGGLPL
jgi:hypothetical protein